MLHQFRPIRSSGPIIVTFLILAILNLLLVPPAAAVDSPYFRDYCLEAAADSMKVGSELTVVTKDGRSIAGSLQEVNKVDRIVRLSILQSGQTDLEDFDLNDVERIEYVHKGKPKWGLAFGAGVAGFVLGYALAGRFDSKDAHFPRERLVYHDAWIPAMVIVLAAPFVVVPMLPEHRTIECK